MVQATGGRWLPGSRRRVGPAIALICQPGIGVLSVGHFVRARASSSREHRTAAVEGALTFLARRGQSFCRRFSWTDHVP
jgi:hypothetical protein